MFDVGPPGANPPPASAEAGEDVGSPRYSYLVSRLRNRQITMEEATELFTLQRQQARTLRVRAAIATAPPPPPREVPGAPSSVSVPAGEATLPGDPLFEGLLLLGIGAGLLAALLRRAQGGPEATRAESQAPSGASAQRR